MDFDIKPGYLLNLDRLKEKLRWPNIVEETDEYGNISFRLIPDHPEGSSIYLESDPRREDLYTVAMYGGAHWHLDDGYYGQWRWRTIWKSLKKVRRLVAGLDCGFESTRADGRPLYGGVISADGWDNLGIIYEYYCLPADGGASGGLISPDGKRWRPPTYKRYYFNRAPSYEQPDWSVFVPLKSGCLAGLLGDAWASPAKRDQLLYDQITLGEISLYEETPPPLEYGYNLHEDPDGPWTGFTGKRYNLKKGEGREILDPRCYRAFRYGWLLEEWFEQALALEEKLKMPLKDRLCGWHDHEFERELDDDDD